MKHVSHTITCEDGIACTAALSLASPSNEFTLLTFLSYFFGSVNLSHSLRSVESSSQEERGKANGALETTSRRSILVGIPRLKGSVITLREFSEVPARLR